MKGTEGNSVCEKKDQHEKSKGKGSEKKERDPEFLDFNNLQSWYEIKERQETKCKKV